MVETALYRRMSVQVRLERSDYMTDVIISLSAGSAGKDKAPPPVRFRKEGWRFRLQKRIAAAVIRVLTAAICAKRRDKARNVKRRIER